MHSGWSDMCDVYVVEGQRRGTRGDVCTHVLGDIPVSPWLSEILHVFPLLRLCCITMQWLVSHSYLACKHDSGVQGRHV